MSATQGLFILDSENTVVGGKPMMDKTAKGSFGSAARKKLGDISNLPHRPKDDKQQLVSNTGKQYIEQLQKENMMLMKNLVDRNKIIELTGNELQKLRINMQKMQQQNIQLAQSNSQLLVELNSGKDRLKALHHELGCTNGLLRAKKKELEEKANVGTSQKTENQARTSKTEEAREPSEADRGDNKHFDGRRKQQSKSLGPSNVKQVQLKEKAESKRASLRRRSGTFEPDSNGQFPVCSLDDDRMQEKVPLLDSKELEEAKESLQEDRAGLGPSTRPVQLKEKNENKRVCLRRSARFQVEEPALNENVFDTDDAKFPSCSMSDKQTQDDCSTSIHLSAGKDDEDNSSCPSDDEARNPIARPSRTAAKKVQSYKEIPINLKMRRPE